MEIEDACKAIAADDFAAGYFAGIMLLGTMLRSRGDKVGYAKSFELGEEMLGTTARQLLERAPTSEELLALSDAVCEAAQLRIAVVGLTGSPQRFRPGKGG